MFPNAITDRRVVPYPDTPPTLGCAGSLIVDPFAGNEILRVTDADSNPAAPGRTYTTPDSSEAQPWAADSSAFVIRDTNGWQWLYRFDLCDFSAERQPDALPLDGAQFSFQQPNLIWGNKGLALQHFDWITKQAETVCDLDNSEIEIPASPRWYITSLSNDWADARIVFAMGPGQDQNDLVVVWDSRLGLCWLNTATGVYDGFASGMILPWTPFKVHNTRIAKDGALVKISPAGYKGMAFWTPGTSQFALVPHSSDHSPFQGHQALGFGTYYGAVLKSCWCQWVKMPFWHWVDGWTNLQNPVPATAPEWADYHASVWPDSADRNPIFVSTYDGNVKEPGAPLNSWVGVNEIIAMTTDGSGAWWRLAHHYASGAAGFYSSPRGNVSLDGCYFLFTSDWQQTLGGRSDVFCLRMQ